MASAELKMWACTVCTFENQASSSECEACCLPRRASVDSKTTWWQCLNCCQLNEEHLARCALCNHRKGVSLRGAKTVSLSEEKEVEREKPQEDTASREAEKTQHSGERASSDVDTTEYIGTPTPEETQWICQNLLDSAKCNTVNNPDVYRCSNCKKSKPYLPHLTTIVSQVTDDLAVTNLATSSTTRGDWEPAGNNGRQSDLPNSERRSSSRHTHGPSEDDCYIDWSSMDVRDRGHGHVAGDDLVAIRGAEAPTHPPTTDEDDVEFPDHECRIVLVGKTGNGKSSLANTLLGMKRFDARPDFASTTKKCQRYNTVRFGVRLEVVDTPGFFDTELDKETIAKEIAKCFGIIAPGPHAIILVLRIGVRFTKEENNAVDEVYKVFGAHLLRYLVIVFTHGDSLKTSGEGNMDAMLESAPDKLKELLTRANHRYVVFDNTADEATKGLQVKQLLVTVKKLLEVNGGNPFTSETLRIVERCMKGRESELEAEHKGARRRNRAGRTGEYRFQCRDMARDEVAQEGPLLDTIKTHVLPVLQKVLWGLLTILVQVAMKQGRCTLQ